MRVIVNGDKKRCMDRLPIYLLDVAWAQQGTQLLVQMFLAFDQAGLGIESSVS